MSSPDHEACESKALRLTVESTDNLNVAEATKKSFWLSARRWIRTVGAEEFGIERIPEGMRTNQNPRDLFTLFFSANCNTATLALGVLAPTYFGLGWWDSFCSIFFFNLLGAIVAALAARFGPKLGLRGMIVPRYSFGWWPAKVLAILNVVNQLGFAIVNGISGGSVLYDVGDGKLPLSICVLLVGLLAIAFGLLGYKLLHIYDRYSWIVMLFCFIIVAGMGGQHFVNVPFALSSLLMITRMGSGSVEAAAVLSFGTAIIGFQTTWVPVAADYGVYMRETISDRKTFGWAFAGLFLSQVLVEFLGAAVGTLSLSNQDLFTHAYESRGLGGLIGSVFEGHGAGVRGFGKFIEVLLGFSTVPIITVNIYSLGLSVQMITQRLLAVPRLVWSLLGSVAFMACAIAGRSHLEDVMSNFLLMVAYWIVPFCTILFLEHFIWRRGYQYDLTAWNDRQMLPHGIAASIAFVIGTALAVISMSQDWWIGPIAAAIGGSPYGTDISWILAFAASGVLYVPLRHFERKKWNL